MAAVFSVIGLMAGGQDVAPAAGSAEPSPFEIIGPKGDARLSPEDMQELRLRWRGGTAPFRIRAVLLGIGEGSHEYVLRESYVPEKLLETGPRGQHSVCLPLLLARYGTKMPTVSVEKRLLWGVVDASGERHTERFRTPPGSVSSSEIPAPQAPPSEIPAPQVPPSEIPVPQVPPSEIPAPQAPPSEIPAPQVPPSEIPAPQVPPSEIPVPQAPPSENHVLADEPEDTGEGWSPLWIVGGAVVELFLLLLAWRLGALSAGRRDEGGVSSLHGQPSPEIDGVREAIEATRAEVAGLGRMVRQLTAGDSPDRRGDAAAAVLAKVEETHALLRNWQKAAADASVAQGIEKIHSLLLKQSSEVPGTPLPPKAEVTQALLLELVDLLKASQEEAAPPPSLSAKESIETPSQPPVEQAASKEKPQRKHRSTKASASRAPKPSGKQAGTSSPPSETPPLPNMEEAGSPPTLSTEQAQALQDVRDGIASVLPPSGRKLWAGVQRARVFDECLDGIGPKLSALLKKAGEESAELGQWLRLAHEAEGLVEGKSDGAALVREAETLLRRCRDLAKSFPADLEKTMGRLQEQFICELERVYLDAAKPQPSGDQREALAAVADVLATMGLELIAVSFGSDCPPEPRVHTVVATEPTRSQRRNTVCRVLGMGYRNRETGEFRPAQVAVAESESNGGGR